MQIETLNIYCDVIRLKSFSKGAEKNNVTQPMASQAVHLLEDHLGVKLIDRSKRPWKPTAEGIFFYDKVKRILERYYDVERAIRGFHEQIESSVRIASIYSAGLRHIKAYVQAFMGKYPDSKINLEYLHPHKVYKSVLDEEADLGIVSFPHLRREFKVLPWRNESMVIIASPLSSIANNLKIGLDNLSGEKFVHFDKDLTIRKEIDKFLKDNGANVEVVLEFDNIEAIKRAVEIGSGISILPKPTCEKEIKIGSLKCIEISGGKFERPLGIISRKGKPFSPTIERFIQFLQNEQINIA